MTSLIARRTLLAVTAFVPAAALVGCAGGATVSTVVADINLVLNGLKSVLPGLTSLIPAATMAQLQTWLADAQAAASAVASGTTGTTAGQQFLSAVESILGVLASLPLIPPPFNAIVGAAAVLLPIIVSALGLATPPSAVKLMAKVPSMTVAEARAILAAQR